MSSLKKMPLESSWVKALTSELDQPYMTKLMSFLDEEEAHGKVIFPTFDHVFNAFNATPFDKVKIVILGQDPYHGPGQAHGLSFSVLPNIKIPPSLVNIFKELEQDLGLPFPQHGCLQHWARQGVLLLNATLTVEQSKAGSHQGKGWERFTDTVIELINQNREGIVFLLWGSFAKKKGALINSNKHYVLYSAHPSPLSAYRGFLGNEHFSKANKYLLEHDQSIIDWSIPDI